MRTLDLSESGNLERLDYEEVPSSGTNRSQSRRQQCPNVGVTEAAERDATLLATRFAIESSL